MNNNPYILKATSPWYHTRKELADRLTELEKAENNYRKLLELDHTSLGHTKVAVKSPHLPDSRTYKLRSNKFNKWYETSVKPAEERASGMDEIILESVNLEVRKADKLTYRDYFRSLGFGMFTRYESTYCRSSKTSSFRRIDWDFTLDLTKELASVLCTDSRFTYEDGYLILPPDAAEVEAHNRDVEWNTWATNKRELDEERLKPTKCKVVLNKYYGTDTGEALPSSHRDLRACVIVFRNETLKVEGHDETRLVAVRNMDFSPSSGSDHLGSYTMLGGDATYELARIYIEASDYIRKLAKTIKPYTDNTHDSVECEPEVKKS
jgi:hypothetical protein